MLKLFCKTWTFFERVWKNFDALFSPPRGSKCLISNGEKLPFPSVYSKLEFIFTYSGSILCTIGEDRVVIILDASSLRSHNTTASYFATVWFGWDEERQGLALFALLLKNNVLVSIHAYLAFLVVFQVNREHGRPRAVRRWVIVATEGQNVLIKNGQEKND